MVMVLRGGRECALGAFYKLYIISIYHQESNENN